MKKIFYRVYIKDTKQNNDIPVICETVSQIDSSCFGRAYIFRDLITGKIIRPLYDCSFDYNYNNLIFTLTYDNTSKDSCVRISSKKVLSFLKQFDMEKIDIYKNTLEEIECNFLKNVNIK